VPEADAHNVAAPPVVVFVPMGSASSTGGRAHLPGLGKFGRIAIRVRGGGGDKLRVNRTQLKRRGEAFTAVATNVDVDRTNIDLPLAVCRWIGRVVEIEINLISCVPVARQRALDDRGAGCRAGIRQDGIILQIVRAGIRVVGIVGGHAVIAEINAEGRIQRNGIFREHCCQNRHQHQARRRCGR